VWIGPSFDRLLFKNVGLVIPCAPIAEQDVMMELGGAACLTTDGEKSARFSLAPKVDPDKIVIVLPRGFSVIGRHRNDPRQDFFMRGACFH
jgi:hypothetical protein